MSWVKIDDRFWSDPDVVAAGNAAAGAFCRLLSYCGAHLTDGEIPAGIAGFIAGDDEIAALVDRGLVTADADAVRIPRYLDYNPARDKVLAERRAAAERQRKAREKREKSRNGSR